jgi:glycosyltransferase involved in cell wall biosynthesis
MKRVSVLVPCFNEEKTLPLFFEALKGVMDGEMEYEWEVLFVNDGSRDDTMGVIRRLYQQDGRVCFVNLSRNFGKENALLAGFDYVSGDCMIIMDADLQDPPSLIPQMLRFWEEGYEDVYARRASRGRESWLRKRLSLAFYHILGRFSRFDVLENVGDFRLLDRACIDALCQLRESDRYTKGMYCWIGFSKKEILFDRGDRVAGESNWRMGSLFNLAIEGITSFTTAPLRLATYAGLCISIGAFGFFLFYMLKTLLIGDSARGFTTLVCISLFMGGVQLLTIGILGEYIGRIFHETKRRPPYLVKECVGRRVPAEFAPAAKTERQGVKVNVMI